MRKFISTKVTITTLSDKELKNLESDFEELENQVYYLIDGMECLEFDSFEEYLSCMLDENEFSNEFVTESYYSSEEMNLD